MLQISTNSPQPFSRWPVRCLSHCLLGSLIRREHTGVTATLSFCQPWAQVPFNLYMEQSSSASALLTCWAGWFVCVEGCAGLCSMFSGIPVLCPLEASSTPLLQLWQLKMSQTFPGVSGWGCAKSDGEPLIQGNSFNTFLFFACFYSGGRIFPLGAGLERAVSLHWNTVFYHLEWWNFALLTKMSQYPHSLSTLPNSYPSTP